ncbi:hypothetical protein ACF0H5_012122 [Mactra antiquata]
MNVGFFVYILLLIAVVTEACPPCLLVKCNPPPEHCSGTIKMGGGYCGCCMACFTYLGEGEQCEVKDVSDTMYYPQTEICASGLYCDSNNSTCTRMSDLSIG